MSDSLDFMFRPIVLVTGFGPFVNHPINASWEAVKLLNKEEIEKKHNVELVKIEIPVTYENVDEFVPALWETHTPKLMIHVGVSGIAQQVTIESQAHKKGYKRLDYLDKCPEHWACPADGAVRLHTKLDVDRLCREFNETCPPERGIVRSDDAGRYLCEYIYYTSLSADNKRSLFVHVPDLTVLSPPSVAERLTRIIELSLKQIDELITDKNEV